MPIQMGIRSKSHKNYTITAKMGKISAATKEEDIKLRFTDILNLVPDGPNQLASRFVVLVQHTINFVKSVADARTFATRIRKVETKEMNINKTYD